MTQLTRDADVCTGSPCEQQCTDNFGRVVCTCYPGYRFDRERHRNHQTPYCLDIDECFVNNGTLCDHQCVNTLGSYMCECQEGFHLSANGKSCRRTFNDSSAIKSDHLMSAAACSVTCEEFLQMKQTLAQLKQKLLFANLDNSSEKTLLARKCTETLPCPPHVPGAPGPPDVRGRFFTQRVGPPGSFDFLLLMMADIRHDIIELQEQVFGEQRGITIDSLPLDTQDAGSGQEKVFPTHPGSHNR
ncbi:hypothetical protein scyTo_0003948 [Scyliorhinus torazame]|uniref:EGF-like domain-containing protein n=1 Tax=Scyliorhinus torazame TaxID=75743 RepID=A0A401NI16_SCYTO|nr:hypothetical protein [Scyliorhinus torazame]